MMPTGWKTWSGCWAPAPAKKLFLTTKDAKSTKGKPKK